MVRRVLLFIITFLFLFIPSSAEAAPKKVEIDLTNQRLYAFEGNTKVYDFIISSGKPWWPTPVGTFKPWAKIGSQRMVGGSKALGTYYNLPNVPNVVYFYRDYAIHGAYWHNNFGYPMSHGCVNVRPSDMAMLYPWIDYSTQITIYGTTPAI